MRKWYYFSVPCKIRHFRHVQLDELRNATATWKIWGNSFGTPEWRLDPQNLPENFLPADWPKWTDGYAVMNNGDWGGVFQKRGEIFDAVRDAGITGFAIVSGDRRSFWAGNHAVVTHSSVRDRKQQETAHVPLEMARLNLCESFARADHRSPYSANGSRCLNVVLKGQRTLISVGRTSGEDLTN